jgi:uncharacterized protein
VIVLVFGRSLAVFYTNALWFEAVGHAAVFWRRLAVVISTRVATGAIGAGIIFLNVWFVLRQLGPVHLRRRYGNIEFAEQVPRSLLVAGAVAVSVLAGWWLSTLQFGGNVPVALLAWLQRESWGVTDPLFGMDLSFYVFGLPVYTRFLEYLLAVLLWAALLVGIGYVLVGAVRVRGSRIDIDYRPRLHFAALAAALLVTFAARYLVGRYGFLLEGSGFGGAIGYTDVHARLPARLLLGVLAIGTAAAVLHGVRRRSLVPPAAALGVLLVAAVGAGMIWPAIVQKVQVEPNQLAREVDYIRWNMEYTRRAYGLDLIERRDFRYTRADPGVWSSMAPVMESCRCGIRYRCRRRSTRCRRAFDYYQFPDVDYDRYGRPASASRWPLPSASSGAMGCRPTRGRGRTIT